MPPMIDHRLPHAIVTLVRHQQIVGPIDSAELFAGRRLVLFGVPGAFTPTCSERHLPGYVALHDAFRALDVAVACLSVNDAFVMRAWAQDQQVPDGLDLLADGNASLTQALDLALDGSAYGLGIRCRRFALYAEDGVLKQWHVEAPGELRVSSAEAMLMAIGGHLPDTQPAGARPCADCGG